MSPCCSSTAIRSGSSRSTARLRSSPSSTTSTRCSRPTVTCRRRRDSRTTCSRTTAGRTPPGPRAGRQHLIVVSGTGKPDPELTAASTVSPAVVHEATAYLQAGGPDNFAQLLRFLADHLLLTGFGHTAPTELPQHGVYHPDLPRG